MERGEPDRVGGAPRSAGPATRLLQKAAALNKIGKYCAAEDLLWKAVAIFESAGDAQRAEDANLQASMTKADCADQKRAQATKQEEKNVYYCVPEEGVYGHAYIPARPGEGCGVGAKTKSLRVPKGSSAKSLRERLRAALAARNRDEDAKAAEPANTAAHDGQKGAGAEIDPKVADRVVEAPPPESDNDILQHYLNGKNSQGIRRDGNLGPPLFSEGISGSGSDITESQPVPNR